MWRFLLLLLLIALPAMAQDARPLLGPGTLPPRGPVAAAPSTIPPLAVAPSVVEAEPAPPPLSGEGKAPEQPLPAQAQQAPMPPPLATPAPGLTLAPDPARCGPAREGQVACMSGRLCACRFERGGQLTGRGDHFAWDCGPLRPSCDLPPADLSGGAVQPEILIMPEIGPRRR